jgi:hypothetical protein
MKAENVRWELHRIKWTPRHLHFAPRSKRPTAASGARQCNGKPGGMRCTFPPYCVRPLHFWSQYLVSRVFRYFVPVWVWKNRVHGTVIS